MEILAIRCASPSINDRFDDVYGTIYALSGDEFSYEEKRQQAEDLKRQLLSVPNVKKITLIGVQEKSLDVTINKDKLASYQVSTQQLLNGPQTAKRHGASGHGQYGYE